VAKASCAPLLFSLSDILETAPVGANPDA
jgi:hypothetical protein